VVIGVGQEVKEDITELFALFGIREFNIEQELTIDHKTWWHEMTLLQEDDLDFSYPYSSGSFLSTLFPS